LSGSYAPASTGTLSIAVGGTTAVGTGYGQLAASGPATLSGTLAIHTASGVLPALGTAITLRKASSVTGTFSSVTGTQLSGERWVVSYTTTSVVLTIVSG
jgi:hypothetical protein